MQRERCLIVVWGLSWQGLYFVAANFIPRTWHVDGPLSNFFFFFFKALKEVDGLRKGIPDIGISKYKVPRV